MEHPTSPACRPPALVVRLAVEQPVAVYYDAADRGERDRVLDWIKHHPAYDDLVWRAVLLAQREPAA
jgi:hypothetical protein